jgi:hypothetical protein
MFRPKGPLPTYSILGETKEKRQKLLSAFTDIVTEAIYYLGKDQVRQIVAKATRAPRGKRTNVDRDQQLLAEYFAEATKGSTVNVSKLAVRLYKNNPKQFGASALAIEKHLYRLLKQLKQANDRSENATRRLRDFISQALNHQPTSILGSDK